MNLKSLRALGPLVLVFSILVCRINASTPYGADNYAVDGEAWLDLGTAPTTSLTTNPVVTPTSPSSQTASPGQSVTFSISDSGGTSPLTYEWTDNGNTVAGASGPTLTLSNVQPSNAGNYLVTLIDEYGNTATADFNLSVPSGGDTPAMPPWALALLAVLLCSVAAWIAAKKTPGANLPGGRLGVWIVGTLLLFAHTPQLRAQQLDNPVTYGLSMTSTVTAGTATAGGVTVEEGSTVIANAANGSSAIGELLPNLAYTCVLGVTGNATVTATFASTAGGTVLINGIPQTSAVCTATSQFGGYRGSITFTIEISASVGQLLRAGQASSLAPDKPIWSVGLGRLRNGLSAGSVSFRQSDFTNLQFFTQNILYYSPPDPTETGMVTYSATAATYYQSNWPPGSELLQAFSREVLLNIVFVSSTSYRIDVYPKSQVGALQFVSNGLGGYYTTYAVTGSPVISYTISKLSSGTGVDITRAEDGVTWDTSLSVSYANGTSNPVWTLTDWHVQGTSLSRYVTTTYTGSTSAAVVQTGPNAAGTGQESPMPWSKTFVAFSWGNELTQKQVGSLTSQYSYYSATNGSGGFQGMLESQINPDGSWVLYQYNSLGLAQTVLRPWLNAPTSPSSATTANSFYETYSYNATDPTYLGSHATYAPGGTMLSQTTWSYNFSAGTFTDPNTSVVHTLMTTARNDSSSGSGSIQTISKFITKNDSDTYFENQPVSFAYPNGRKDSFAYFPGTWSSANQTFTASAGGNDRLIMAFHGQVGQSPGGLPQGTQISSWTNSGVAWPVDALYLVPNQSTFTESVVDTTGHSVFKAENVFTTANTLNRISGTLSTYDTHGRLTNQLDIARSSGTNLVQTATTYQLDLVLSVTGADGVPTQMTYDPLLRLSSKTVGGGGITSYPARVEQYLYDGADRLAQQGVGATPSAWTVLSYDSSGRVQTKVEPGPSGGLTTNYSYPNLQSATITDPASATVTTSQYLDGRPESVTGSGTSPVYYEYAANATGLLVRTEHMTPTGSNSSQTLGWTEDQQDYLGRVVLHSMPSWGWPGTSTDIVDASSTYDASTGNLNSTQTVLRSGSQLLPNHLFMYDGAGRLIEDGLDVDNSGTLTAVSTDRITTYSQTYTTDSAGWTSVATTTTAPDVSAGLTLASSTTTRFTGFGTSNGALGIGDVTSVDVSGRATHELDYIQPSTLTSFSNTTLGGVTTVANVTRQNGLLASTISNSGVQEQYLYDSLGRLQTDQWRYDGAHYNVGKTYAYFGNTQYTQTLTEQGSPTNYSYVWGTDGSRTATTTDALGNTTNSQYNPLGLIWQTWGSGTDPSQVAYDALGRRESVTTWQTGTFTGATWPSPGGGNKTAWTVDPATGLVQTKTFADSSHADFTYTPLGQLATRQWWRTLPDSSTRVTTTYSYYDGSAAAGGSGFRTEELRQIAYNDNGVTPTVSYTYKRSGVLDTVTDATGSHSFNYRTNDDKLNYEQLDATFYNSRRLTLGYETGASVGRCNEVEVGTSATPTADYNTTVHYTDTRVTSVDNASSEAPELTFTVGYLPYSDFVQSVTQTNSQYSYGRNYEPSQDLVQTVTNMSGSTVLGEFGYKYTAVRQVQTVGKSGSIFGIYGTGSGILTKYGYDSVSELTSENTYLGTDPTNLSSPVANRSTGTVVYDDAGNRTSVPVNGNTATYTPNSVNQYGRRTNPGTVTTSGSAAVSSAIQVNGQSPSSGQQGQYFSQAISINNGAGPNLTPTRVTTGSNLDQAAAGLKPSYLAPASEAFTYDLDGNLTGDGHWIYAYDAENRLIQMTPQPSALAAGAMDQRLTFTYDYLGRRVEKKVELCEVNGFLGQYFRGSDFAAADHQQTDSQLWFTGQSGSFPGAGQAATNFSTYWSGYVVPPTSGNYQFRFTVSDRFRLWVNGQLAQESWHDQAKTAYITAPLALNAGDHVFVQAEFYQDADGPVAGLEWNVPGVGWEIIPNASVVSPPLGASGTWRTVSDTVFLYDQNNLVEEIQNGQATRSYAWGPDLSYSDQGAGGTGGLLMINDSGQNYFPVYDNMGNIHGLMQGSNGALAATYEYNAFGEVIRQTGAYAATNPLGWNTKYTDRETGLVYFGRRFYNSGLGRFINRDPIEEEGGLNLYCCTGNDSVNHYDLLGMETFDVDPILLDPVVVNGNDPTTYDFSGAEGTPPSTPTPSVPQSGPWTLSYAAWLYYHPGYNTQQAQPPSIFSNASAKTSTGQAPSAGGLSAGQFYNAQGLEEELSSAGGSVSGSLFELTYSEFNSYDLAPGFADNLSGGGGFLGGFDQGFTFKNVAIGAGIGLGIGGLEFATGGAATPFILYGGAALGVAGLGHAAVDIASSDNPGYTAGIYAGQLTSGSLGAGITGGASAGINGLLNAAETETAPLMQQLEQQQAQGTMTQWGWRGGGAWRDAVGQVNAGGTLETIGGNVPTQAEATQLIEDAGGTVQRIEDAHMPPNPHTYPHINYTTASGAKGTIQIGGL
jgi:RHS repeat-associated protein